MNIFRLPTEIIHGNGAFKEFAGRPIFVGKRNGLFLSRSVHGAYPEVRAFADLLKDISKKAVVETVQSGEPDLEVVRTLRETIERENLDTITAIGGGSVLDAAKAAAGTAWSPWSVDEHYFDAQRLPGRKVFFAAVPTTAGTGTEVTPNAVISAPSKMLKQSLRGPSLYPNIAVVDPELTRGLPMHVAASAGADALVQAIESYFSRHSSPITDALALRAAELCAFSLADAVLGDEPEARARLSTGSLMAGMAFSNSRLGAVHGVVHPVGVITGMPHGVCCAVFMPWVLELNRKAAPEKYAALERLFGGDPPDFLRKLFTRLGLPSDLKSCGVDRSLFPKIVETSLRSGSLKANPREMTPELLMELLEKVL